MPSFIKLPASKVLELANATLDRVEETNKKELAKAILAYRKRGWWIFRPSPTMTDEEIHNILIRDFIYIPSGGRAWAIAFDFTQALEHVDPNSMVQVDVHEFNFLL